MARYIDVLNREEKKVERRTKEALAELGAVMSESKRVKNEVEAAHHTKKTMAKAIGKLHDEIAELTQAADGIRKNKPRDPDVVAVSRGKGSSEDLYASMKPDKYGVAVYRVKNARYDRWFLKMRWGNLARVIAEGTEDAVCGVASNILDLIHPEGKEIHAIQVTDKKAIFDTKDC